LIRGGSTSLNAKPSKQTIRNALGYLKNFIDTTKHDRLSPQVKANKDYKNYLMLAYYRNNLIHLFLNECYIAASFLAFGEQITAQ
jgi:glycerol-3-phosphate O-acyltransferase